MLCVVVLIIVLIPVTFVPLAGEVYDPLAVFYEPKFEVLRVLSVPLLIVVILDREPRLVPVLVPALAYVGVSVLSTIGS